MQAKVLCILLTAVGAFSALIPPLAGRAVIDAGISISRDGQPLVPPLPPKPTPPPIKPTPLSKPIPLPVIPTLLPKNKPTEQQKVPDIPKIFENELQNLARLGQGSSQFVNILLKDVQKWVDDAARARIPCPSTVATSTSSPSSSGTEPSTTDGTSSSTEVSSSTTSAQLPTSTDDDSSSNSSSEEATSASTTPSTTTTTTPSTTTTNSPPTTRRRRRPRDVGDLLANLDADSFSRVLDFNPLGNVSSILAKVDFSKVSRPVPKIPPPQDISKLPVLPGLRENVKYARDTTTRVLGGRTDLQTAIQDASQRAIRSVDPVGALTALCYTILHIYYNIAVNSPLFIVGTAVLQDGLLVIGSVIKSVILIVSSDIAKLVR